MEKSGNLLSLWEAALEPSQIPVYPGMSLKRDEQGELVRDFDLRYIADLRENLLFRASINLACRNNPEVQKIHWNLCKSSILYWVNVFCFTHDPRLLHTQSPFVTYPFQDDILTWMLWNVKSGLSGLIEKSRDMGLSWCLMAVCLYLNLFYDGTVSYALSLRESDVDSRTEDSLLGKYRYLLRHLPEWMRAGWIEKEMDIDNKLSIKIPVRNSLMRGQLTGGTSRRSGRATFAFYDEFAFIEDSQKVLKASSSISPCCLFLSTPNGMGNEFYRMATLPEVNKKSLHWTLHPLKNKEWAKRERAKPQYTDEIWAQEHELDYAQSTMERVYKQFISFTASAYDWQHPQSGEYYEYDPHFDVYAGMDLGINDPTSIVFAQIKPTPTNFQTYTKETLVIFAHFETNNWTVDKWGGYIKGTGYT